MAIETFNILNNMSPVLSDLINLRENSTCNFRCNNILQIPQVRTSKFDKKSLRYAAAVINWTASTNSGKFRGIRPWMYIEDQL